MLNFEHFERGYLLPKGCKDLIDVINRRGQQKGKILLKPVASASHHPPAGKAELLVSEHVTVAELAALLRQKPFQIIADLMLSGVFVTVNQSLGFGAISLIARRYGYNAKRTV